MITTAEQILKTQVADLVWAQAIQIARIQELEKEIEDLKKEKE